MVSEHVSGYQAMACSYESKLTCGSTSGNKIPPFDGKNLSMWKRKYMVVLETFDYNMTDIFDKGQHVPMFL